LLLLLLLPLLLLFRYGNPAFRSWFAAMMDRTPQWVSKVRLNATQHRCCVIQGLLQLA
jgi:hypothetical protein